MPDLTTDILEYYDTVVVGAGPAGVMAAYHAAARGSVLLADAASLPRDKSCGGMLNEYTQQFLEPYGHVPDDIVLDPQWVNFRYHDWDRGIRKPTQLRFLNVSRAGFDEWLLTLLPPAVTVCGSLSLQRFDQDTTEVRAEFRAADGERRVRCANLIGADGARSAVRRALGAGSAATYVTLQDFCEVTGDLEPFFDCIYLRGVGDCFGYAYVVPKGDAAIVGSVFYPKTKRPHEKQDLIVERMRSALPLGPARKREASVALYVRDRADVAPGSGRVLLAGEAGGWMSPTSGEGISYALNSGVLAGRAVAETDPDEATAALEAFLDATMGIRSNIRRKLRWLPIMESSAGKYFAGFVPTPLVSRVTKGL